MYKVLIVSFANWDSMMELPFVFKEAGCVVDVFSVKDSWVLKSSYYDNYIEGSADPDEFVSQLVALVREKGDDYNWIIPGDDIIIRMLNDSITSEELFYKILPLNNIVNRELLGSKAGFSILCAKYDIETPRFLIYAPTMTLQSISKFMGYPLMLKTDKSEAGTGVFKCDNEAELKQNLDRIENKENIVFQQYIDGYDINMEVLFKDGELIVYSYARLLMILGKFGLSTQRMFTQNTEIIPQLVKVGRSMGINGFASIAFMYSIPDRKHYLIEVDVRPNSWIYYGKFTGNNFTEGIKKIKKGDLTLLHHDETKYPKEVKISLYKKDMMRAIVQKDVMGVLAWTFNKDQCRRFIPTYDKSLQKAINQYLLWFFRELVKEKIEKITGKRKG